MFTRSRSKRNPGPAQAAGDISQTLAHGAQGAAARVGGVAEQAGGRIAREAGEARGRAAKQAGRVRGRAAEQAGRVRGRSTHQAGHIGGRVAQEAGHIGGRVAQEAGHIGGRVAQEAGHIGGQLAQEAGQARGRVAQETGQVSGQLNKQGRRGRAARRRAAADALLKAQLAKTSRELAHESSELGDAVHSLNKVIKANRKAAARGRTRLLGGIALGATLMYHLDPQRGRERRAETARRLSRIAGRAETPGPAA